MIGSGIAAQQLSPGDIGLELFENAAATAVGLYTIILMFGPVSGGHFNPVVSLVDASFGGLSWRDALAYIPAQVTGCIVGALAANGMFALSLVSDLDQAPRQRRPLPVGDDRDPRAAARDLLARPHQARVLRTRRRRRVHRRRVLLHQLHELRQSGDHVGRMFSNTFAGIAPASVPAYVIAQLVGGIVSDRRPAHALPRRNARGGRRCHPPPPRRPKRPDPDRTHMTNVLFVCLHNAGRSQMSQVQTFDRFPTAANPAAHVNDRPLGVLPFAWLLHNSTAVGQRPTTGRKAARNWDDRPRSGFFRR